MNSRVTGSPDLVTPGDTPEAPGSGVPQHVLDDPKGRAWLAAFQAAELACAWDHGDVDFLLKEAFTLLRRLGGRIGPKRDNGFWPQITRGLDPEDVLERRDSRKVTASVVSRVEATLDWLRIDARDPWLPADTQERNALMLWCWCIEHGQKFAQVVEDLAAHGVKKATIDRHRRRASMMLAARLIQAQVRLPAEVLDARQRRPRSDMHEPPAAEAPAPAAAARDVPGWPLPEFWAEVERGQNPAEPAARDDAVLTLIHERVRAEHAGAGTDAAALQLLHRRRSQLVSEAIRRGFLGREASRSLKLSKDELGERVRNLRGDA